MVSQDISHPAGMSDYKPYCTHCTVNFCHWNFFCTHLLQAAVSNRFSMFVSKARLDGGKRVSGYMATFFQSPLHGT